MRSRTPHPRPSASNSIGQQHPQQGRQTSPRTGVRAPSAASMREVRSDNAPTEDTGESRSTELVEHSIRMAETKLPSRLSIVGPELGTGPV
jgi:hypothetical protein